MPDDPNAPVSQADFRAVVVHLAALQKAAIELSTLVSIDRHDEVHEIWKEISRNFVELQDYVPEVFDLFSKGPE